MLTNNSDGIESQDHEPPRPLACRVDSHCAPGGPYCYCMRCAPVVTGAQRSSKTWLGRSKRRAGDGFIDLRALRRTL